MMNDANLPSIIVSRSSRGTIYHSLLTSRVMAASNLALATLEWRPSYQEYFRLFMRELGRRPALTALLEPWT